MCVITDKKGYKHEKWHYLNIRHVSSGPWCQEGGRAGPWLPDQLGPVPAPAQPQAGGSEALPEDARPALCPAGADRRKLCSCQPSTAFHGGGFVRPLRGLSHSQGPVLLGCLPLGGLSRRDGAVRGLGSCLPLPTRWGFPASTQGHVSCTAGPMRRAGALVMQAAVP